MSFFNDRSPSLISLLDLSYKQYYYTEYLGTVLLDWNRPRSRAHTMFFAILHSIIPFKCTKTIFVWALDLGRFQSIIIDIQ